MTAQVIAARKPMYWPYWKKMWAPSAMTDIGADEVNMGGMKTSEKEKGF